jgi:hypothetical protein
MVIVPSPPVSLTLNPQSMDLLKFYGIPLTYNNTNSWIDSPIILGRSIRLGRWVKSYINWQANDGNSPTSLNFCELEDCNGTALNILNLYPNSHPQCSTRSRRLPRRPLLGDPPPVHLPPKEASCILFRGWNGITRSKTSKLSQNNAVIAILAITVYKALFIRDINSFRDLKIQFLRIPFTSWVKTK